jgi:Secretion system C-terminal sorting domain
MKGILFFWLLIFSSGFTFSQAYQPMPVDSATWRYRSLMVDDVVAVSDFILYQNGTDTVLAGITYKKIFSRSFNQSGPTGFNPPIVSVTANAADFYYGGIRENGKKVYFLSGTHEQLIFDFNAAIGSYIPTSGATVLVTSIDSILIGVNWHKRYKTTDTTYYVVEGVGSNRGLIPDLSDGSGTVVFHCFSHLPDEWTPILSTGCTSVYPAGYDNSVKTVGPIHGLTVYPNPTTNVLHILNSDPGAIPVTITNMLGKIVWKGEIDHNKVIPVDRWPPGIYYLQSGNSQGTSHAIKVLLY